MGLLAVPWGCAKISPASGRKAGSAISWPEQGLGAEELAPPSPADHLSRLEQTLPLLAPGYFHGQSDGPREGSGRSWYQSKRNLCLAK